MIGGAAIGRALGNTACMASTVGGAGGDGGNRHENREFKEAVRRIERARGKPLRRDQIEQLHREISKQGFSLTEIVDLGMAMFGLRP